MATEVQHIDLKEKDLMRLALERKEGVLNAYGTLCVKTGKRTGRSPKDRFIVCDDLTEKTVSWGEVNQPIDPEKFEQLWLRVKEHLHHRVTFVSHLHVGAHPAYYLPLHVRTETAWHSLFARHLFLRPEVYNPLNKPKWQILHAANFITDPDRDGVSSDGAVLIDLQQCRVLLAGMRYAGEMKKAMFSSLNYQLPEVDVLPMHCAANQGEQGDVALFFGLSGTGKTTLSADPERYLIGDDEHGWGQDGVFNFEGGCYAKCIHLSEKTEPVIWKAIHEPAIMENVILAPQTKIPNYEDTSLSQNMRVAYPRTHIPKRVLANRGGVPQAVIFLTCDLHGVLPPVAVLTKHQAAYYFLSGYTALVGGTEMGEHGAASVRATFSVCFGAPFFPRPVSVYAELLMKRIEETQCPVYLVNTGWTGGGFKQGGKRFSIGTTRAIVRAILCGEVQSAEHERLPGFGFVVPKRLDGIDSKILNPVRTWSDAQAYKKEAKRLIEAFINNFKRFDMSAEIVASGPKINEL